MGFDKWRVFVIPNSEEGGYVFHSGSTLSGRVVIDQDKEKSVEGVYVQLKGYCKVKWTSDFGKEVNKSYEEYIDEKVYILKSNDGEFKIQPGIHEYRYKFNIPPYCPASYDGKYGHIRYELNLILERTFLPNQVRRGQITVIAPLDLNLFPGVRDQIRLQVNKSFSSCCVNSGQVETLVKCPVSGYCPGQSIPIKVLCENNSSVTITNILFELYEVTTFYTVDTKASQRVVAKKAVGPVPPRGTLDRSVELKVPSTAINLRECKFIDIDFFFRVTVLPAGCHIGASKTHGILIGTIPLRDQLRPPDLSSQPSGSRFQPPGLPSPPNYLHSPPLTAINDPYINGNPYTCDNPPYNPNFGPNTSYHVHPEHLNNIYPAVSHKSPPPSYLEVVAPSAPEAEDSILIPSKNN